ncbi:MAG: DNA gyrase/topoisomerase IV subunit A [Actinomycetota bacterium]
MSEQQRLLDDGGRDDAVVDVDIAERMERSFLDYSMSVIVGRALPDVRDGLKPVQRRILQAMWEAGLRPDRPYRKCASAVGDVMKKYHPHGDASIYEALVRMAQDFASREPLVDGHGNFGSIDGDSAAAMRYTEARLSPLAMELLDGLDEDTVDEVANYDGHETEPVVLPARFPNLLVNGSAGIAVGMATSIPPHNLGEAIDATIHLVAHPEASVDELMAIMPGPDFPTGGRILEGEGIRAAYLTGKGAITTEAIATTETRSGGLPRIVITEIPYQVNKATLLERIADLVTRRKLDAIRDLRDESSRDGMRIVVELKRGEDPQRALAALYDATDLRQTFHANLVALTTPEPGAQPEPRTLGLRELLGDYVAHQREVLTRRTRHRRERAAARAHVLEGLLVALDHLDAVIALIRAADSADVARGQLMERYDLTEVQASAILDMQLRRLARLEAARLAEEHAELVERIARLDAILADPGELDALLTSELAELKARHPSPRRSRLAAAPAVASAEGDEGLPELAAQEVTVSLTRSGYVRSVGSRRTTAPHAHPKDPLAAVLRATTDDTVLAVDAAGGGYRIALRDVPVVTARHRGVTLAQLLGEAPAAPLVGAVLLGEGVSEVLTASASGLLKRTAREAYEGRARTMVAAGLREGDHLVAAAGCGPDDELLLAHSGGLVLRCAVADLRAMGRSASGVVGQAVPDDAHLVTLGVLPADGAPADVLTIGAGGQAKRAPLEEYPRQRRGGKGVQTGVSELAWCGPAVDLHVPLGEEVRVLRPSEVEPGRRAGRATMSLAAPTAPIVAESGARPDV